MKKSSFTYSFHLVGFIKHKDRDVFKALHGCKLLTPIFSILSAISKNDRVVMARKIEKKLA